MVIYLTTPFLELYICAFKKTPNYGNEIIQF